MAKSRSRKDSITLPRNAFIGLLLFIVACTILVVYAYMGYAGY